MRRTRKIAAAPQRSAGEAWGAIADLINDTLTRSDKIDVAEVDGALSAAGGAGRMLIGGGHLNTSPLTLVAGGVHVEITTVSGDAAVGMEENLNPVPGAAMAEDWTLYLPTPDPLEDAITAAAKAHPRLSAGEAPEPVDETDSSQAALVDTAALERWGNTE